jgi:hypothetical protein
MYVLVQIKPGSFRGLNVLARIAIFFEMCIGFLYSESCLVGSDPSIVKKIESAGFSDES